MVEHATDNRKILVQLKVLRPIWRVRQIGMAPVLKTGVVKHIRVRVPNSPPLLY